jgi:hypothetical protein
MHKKTHFQIALDKNGNIIEVLEKSSAKGGKAAGAAEFTAFKKKRHHHDPVVKIGKIEVLRSKAKKPAKAAAAIPPDCFRDMVGRMWCP